MTLPTADVNNPSQRVCATFGGSPGNARVLPEADGDTCARACHRRRPKACRTPAEPTPPTPHTLRSSGASEREAAGWATPSTCSANGSSACGIVMPECRDLTLLPASAEDFKAVGTAAGSGAQAQGGPVSLLQRWLHGGTGPLSPHLPHFPALSPICPSAAYSRLPSARAMVRNSRGLAGHGRRALW